VWTESPVWKPEKTTEDGPKGGAKKLVEGVYEQSCYDSRTSSVQVNMDIDLNKKVWVAIGFRNSEECLMTPRGGADGEVLVAMPSEDGNTWGLHHGPLSPTLKTMGGEKGVADFMAGVKPLDTVKDFEAGGMVEYNNGKFTLAFKRAYSTKPEALHLTFAYGLAEKFGYHSNRGCFKVEDMPECPPTMCPASSKAATNRTAVDMTVSSNANARKLVAGVSTGLFASWWN
jgi:hypothetical protein